MNEIRIRRRREPADETLLSRAAAMPSTVLSDALGRDSCPAGLRLFSSVQRLGGTDGWDRADRPHPP